jgi:putative photosynthetic complex assembly protein
MSHAHEHPTVPRPVLLLAAGMCLFTLVVAGISAHDKRVNRATTDAQIMTMIEEGSAVRADLAFQDKPDGSILVLNQHGDLVTEVRPAEDSFVRGVLRGFARERRARNIGTVPVFVLSYAEDGRMTLHDPQTGHRVVLNAFGPDNVRAFARLLFAANPGVANPEGAVQ